MTRAIIAADLEQVGFDKKNITLATELRGKSDFDKRFQAFLATVKEGDVVLFFYSGHGLGVEANNTDYLLLSDIKSLRAYTRDQVIDADKRRDDIISLKMPSFEGAYETDEIAKNGVSVTDVMNAIADKKPKIRHSVSGCVPFDHPRDGGRAGDQARDYLRQSTAADEGRAGRLDGGVLGLLRRDRDRELRICGSPSQFPLHRSCPVGVAAARTDPCRTRPAG